MLATILKVDVVVLVVALIVQYRQRRQDTAKPAEPVAVPTVSAAQVVPAAPAMAVVVPRPGKVGLATDVIRWLGLMPIMLGVVIASQMGGGEFAVSLLALGILFIAAGVAWIAAVTVIAKLLTRPRRD